MPETKPQYTAEFKAEAVQLVLSTEKSCAEVARDLGVAPYLVVRWKKHQEQQRAAGRPTHTGRGVAALSEPEAKLKSLQRELDVTRQERDILKKALAFFAKEQCSTALLRRTAASFRLHYCARRSELASVDISPGEEGRRATMSKKTEH